MQMARKRERDEQRKEKAAERRSSQKLRLKLREIGPPDDLDVEMTALRAAARLKGIPDTDIVRPQFPPVTITSRRKAAFLGV